MAQTNKLNVNGFRTFAQGRLVVELKGQIAWLRLNRPEKKNAINSLMWREIVTALHWIEDQQNIRCVLLEGSGGRDFSAGADISEFDNLRDSAHSAESYERVNSEAFRAVRLHPTPVIAVVRGVCFGGAFGLAAAADLRIASGTAVFAVPAGRLGLSYPADAMTDIVEAAGQQMARYLLFTAKRLAADQALAAGFLLAVHPDEQLDRQALELAETVCANAPLSNRASKAAVRAAISGTQADLTRATEIGRLTFDSEDYREGRNAFRQKRKPVFTGK